MEILLKIPQRLRKFIGVLLLVPLIMVYALLAMVLAVKLLPGTPGFVQAFYYGVAGLLWTIPAAGIIWFMQKRKPEAGNQKPGSL
jgi:hypothetical protein